MKAVIEKEQQRMPLVDLEFRFNLPGRIWAGCDEDWVREMSLQACNWLNSQPYAIGSMPYEDELFACLWRDVDRSQGDIVYMIIATQAHIDDHRHEHKGAIALTLGFGTGKSSYEVAQMLKTDEYVRMLKDVLEIVLAQGRLRIV